MRDLFNGIKKNDTASITQAPWFLIQFSKCLKIGTQNTSTGLHNVVKEVILKAGEDTYKSYEASTIFESFDSLSDGA